MRGFVVPFHGGGQERTASCKITVDPSRGSPGAFYCFGCRERPPAGVTSWDHFAAATGLVPFRPSQAVHDTTGFSFAAAETALTDEQRAAPEWTSAPRLPLKGLLAWPDSPWRGIDGATMRALDARVLYRHNEINVYFPVCVHNNYVGGVYAAVEITDEQKAAGKKAYINTAGRWANDNLFGYNIARARRGPLWAVEGPRDTAKVVQLGDRGVGLLSAHVSARKIALIEALDPPCLIIGLDPDDAGDRGREKLHAAFDRHIPVYDVHFPPGKDPAKMNPRVHARILEKLGLPHGHTPSRSDSRRPAYCD